MPGASRWSKVVCAAIGAQAIKKTFCRRIPFWLLFSNSSLHSELKQTTHDYPTTSYMALYCPNRPGLFLYDLFYQSFFVRHPDRSIARLIQQKIAKDGTGHFALNQSGPVAK